MIKEKRVIKRNLKREKVRTLKRRVIRRIYYDFIIIICIYLKNYSVNFVNITIRLKIKIQFEHK